MHTYKLTTKCHFCAYLYALWLDMWDMGLAIHVVEDLNESQDPKHFFYSRAPLRFLRNCLQLSKVFFIPMIEMLKQLVYGV